MKKLKFDNSNKLIQLARKITPLGAQTYSKSYRYHVAGNAPLFVERGKGSKIWDIEVTNLLILSLLLDQLQLVITTVKLIVQSKLN